MTAAGMVLPVALGVTFLGLSAVFWAINADWGALRKRTAAAWRRCGGGRRGRR